MPGNSTLPRFRRIVDMSGELSSESVTAMAELGSEISTKLGLDRKPRCDSPIPGYTGVSGAVLLEAIGGRVQKNQTLSAAAGTSEDMDKLLLADSLVKGTIYKRLFPEGR
jgi:hypothetical protein